jgi:hypothetical protein
VAGNGKNGTRAGARWAELTTFAAEQLWAGRTVRQVVRELEERGLEYAVAVVLVERIEEELRRGGAL